MGGQQQPDLYGYSTHATGDSSSGYQHAGGKKLIISPDQLNDSISAYKKQLDGQGPMDLVNTLINAVVDPTAFGRIPNADHASTQLRRFITDHVEAMASMGVSLTEFIARVQAAAELGDQAGAHTRAIAAQAQAE